MSIIILPSSSESLKTARFLVRMGDPLRFDTALPLREREPDRERERERDRDSKIIKKQKSTFLFYFYQFG